MPLQRPEDNRFRMWHIGELYFGGPQVGTQFIPNVNDGVVNWDEAIYRVLSVDNVGIPTLELKHRFNNDASIDLDTRSLLTSLSMYQPNAATSAFFDDSVTPFQVTIDTNFPVQGVESEKMVFYKGVETGATGKIISQKFNATGDLIGNEVDLIALDPAAPAIKRPLPWTTSERLVGGDIITGVVYNSAGVGISKTSFFVRESAVVRPLDRSGIFLEGVRIVSPLLDPVDNTLIRVTANTPFNTSLLRGELIYSDGTRVVKDIDGSKMRLLGVDGFDTASVVKPTELVLVYYPDANEPYINASGFGTRTHLYKMYRVANKLQANSYALKLFVVPQYVNSVQGYTLRWRLANIERDIDIDVTGDVIVKRRDGANFNPVDYGNVQSLDVSLALEDIIPARYGDYIHTQKLDITLNLPSTSGKDAFVIDYLSDGVNLYGKGIWASAQTGAAGKVLLSNGKGTVTEWLSFLYNSIIPLTDLDLGPTPPTPTHFRYQYEGVDSPVFAISNWNVQLAKAAGIPTWEKDKTINIVWLLSNAGNYDVLGHSPLVVKLDLV